MGKKTRAGITFILIAILPSIAVRAQISPGDLAEPHAHLEGLSNCTKCHILGEKVANDKCLACHDLLKSKIDQNKGYHVSTDVKGKECISCHSDHHGRKFELIRFDRDQFDHDLTGYKLEGKHGEIECKDCHKNDFIQNEKARKKKFTFLGLNTKCLSCHADYHQQTLSNDCASCHNFTKFRPAVKFDHSKTDYKLLGKHQDVTCIKCHKKETRNGREFQQFANIPFESCVNCHKDVHNNRFGQNCKQCHTEESFHKIIGITSFDHSKTDYPLQGRHLFVKCKDCHKGSYTQPMAHNRCNDCHSDYHEGQLSNAGQSPDCATCHTVDGFSPSRYSFEMHNKSDFPLKGSHLATPCFLCHKKENKKKWQFENIGMRCVDCHEDIHKPYLDKKYYPEATCSGCHRETRWNEVEFNHNKTDYKLEGKHREQTCRSCHFKKENGNIHQRFSGLTAACLNCHKDIHHEQFAEKGETGCLSCHGYENWKAGKFDHSKTNFSLEGAHQNVACIKCHKPLQLEQQTYILYKIPDYRCEACHK